MFHEVSFFVLCFQDYHSTFENFPLNAHNFPDFSAHDTAHCPSLCLHISGPGLHRMDCRIDVMRDILFESVVRVFAPELVY